MLLSEAARTGRKFWRKSNPNVQYWLEGKQIRWDDDGISTQAPPMDAEMIVATDWEVEPKSITITAKDLREATVLLGSKARTPADVVNHIIEELELDL